MPLTGARCAWFVPCADVCMYPYVHYIHTDTRMCTIPVCVCPRTYICISTHTCEHTYYVCIRYVCALYLCMYQYAHVFGRHAHIALAYAADGHGRLRPDLQAAWPQRWARTEQRGGRGWRSVGARSESAAGGKGAAEQAGILGHHRSGPGSSRRTETALQSVMIAGPAPKSSPPLFAPAVRPETMRTEQRSQSRPRHRGTTWCGPGLGATRIVAAPMEGRKEEERSREGP
jgi:hypothetical protein